MIAMSKTRLSYDIGQFLSFVIINIYIDSMNISSIGENKHICHPRQYFKQSNDSSMITSEKYSIFFCSMTNVYILRFWSEEVVWENESVMWLSLKIHDGATYMNTFTMVELWYLHTHTIFTKMTTCTYRLSEIISIDYFLCGYILKGTLMQIWKSPHIFVFI